MLISLQNIGDFPCVLIKALHNKCEIALVAAHRSAQVNSYQDMSKSLIILLMIE